MRTTVTFLACMALAALLSATTVRPVAAQDSIVLDDSVVEGMDGTPNACGCRNTQSPPWHGNVTGDPCGPSCPPPNVFHADPCRQLWEKHGARAHGCVLPPHFPRLHARHATGSWPTPRPITSPRCPNCGVHIDGGW